jgi:hypothetical protein
MPRDHVNNDHLQLKDQLTVILSALDNARRLIEGGKVRRWQVFNRAVALNLVIFSVIALRDAQSVLLTNHWLLFLTCAASAFNTVFASFLIDHYDTRVKKSRDRANCLYPWLHAKIGIDPLATMGETNAIPSDQKDVVENRIFHTSLGLTFAAVSVAIASVW